MKSRYTIIFLCVVLVLYVSGCNLPAFDSAPTAHVSGPQTGTVGQSLEFDAGASGDPDGDALSFVWDFGDGVSGTGETVSHAFSSAGTFTVVLTVNDTDDLDDSDSIEVVIIEASADNGSRIADHTIIHELWDGKIPESAIQDAIDSLHIGYGHTSHGSQLVDGMSGLVAFANAGNLGGTAYTNNLFQWGHADSDPGLHLFEGSQYDPGYLDHDCGYSGWDMKTRTFLDDHENPDGSHQYNVIIWSWCGQVGSFDEQGLTDHYLNAMASLEADYPDVTFVYMTGHLTGGGDSLSDSTFRSNEQIRQFCIDNEKWLFDFADIESYSPDGTINYVHQYGTDGCIYDDDGNGSAERLWVDTGNNTGYWSETLPGGGDANWAADWQNAHTQGTDWYSCGAAHSMALNANMKAYAAWWLWCRLAGWDGT